MNYIENISNKIPTYVFKIARILTKEGFEAYLVGGSVRDIIMKREPKDYDIATDARPEQILKIFPKSISTGAKFGSIIVLMNDEKGESHPVDVTTYRAEQYSTGRWPSKVEFISSLEGDLSRRDFTINSMALDITKMKNSSSDVSVIDPFCGLEDIKKRVVRAVGDPVQRFKEDALRALRACRFASVLEFKIEENTKEAIKSVLTMIDDLSAERVRDEFLKILYDSPKPSYGLRLMYETGIMKIWLRELIEGIDVEQPKYHAFSVFEHLLHAVDKADDSVKLAALFHDIGKPRTITCNGEHFYGHDIESEKMTRIIMKRLRFSTKEIERVSRLVRWHMFYFPYDEDDFKKDSTKVRKNRNIAKWTDSAVRRFIRNVGGEGAVNDLIKLRIADALANPKGSFDPKEIEALQRRIGEIMQKDTALKVTDLNINGNDLISLGIKPGPKLGNILKELLEVVIEDPTLNDKKKLIEIVKERYM